MSKRKPRKMNPLGRPTEEQYAEMAASYAETPPQAIEVTDPAYVEREPAPRKCLHYKGDKVAEVKKRYYFGPTYDPNGGPGKVWKIRSAEYDEAADLTTAWYAPVASYELNAVMNQIHARMGNG